MITSATTLTPTDRVVDVDATSAGFTIKLCPAKDQLYPITFNRIDATANTVTIQAGDATKDSVGGPGTKSVTLPASGASKRLMVSDGVSAYSFVEDPGGAATVNATAVNQNATAVNQNATATNQNATATNQNATAVNQNATATNQNTSVLKLFRFAAPAANAVEVHAGFAGNDASNNFPGPFTNPAIPRTVQIVFAAGWDGGDVTVTGTDYLDQAQNETIADNPGSTVQGVKPFKTVTAATKQAQGASADTATIQTGTLIGIPADVQDAFGMLECDNVGEAVTVDATNNGFTPTSAPNGARNYNLAVNVNHTHTQDAHTHTQNAHTHTQDAHTHTQDAHTHTQNAHTHTQNAHNHV